jgi:hypothetical protein
MAGVDRRVRLWVVLPPVVLALLLTSPKWLRWVRDAAPARA